MNLERLTERWLPWALVGIRVFMGAFFLNEAVHQLTKGWIGGDGLERMLRSALDGHAVPPPYRYFLEHAVIPNDGPFTLLVIAGEIVIGTALILGAATRATALVALFMNLNFLLMNGATAGGAVDAVFVVLEVGLIAWANKQALSIDRVLSDRGVQSPWLGIGAA